MLLGSCLAAAASPSSTTTATSIIPFHESLLSLLHAPQDPQQPLALLLVGPKGHLLTHPDDQQQQGQQPCLDGWMDGCIDGCIDGWMDG